MLILLVEPYFGGSHRAWAEGYARHSAHSVALVTHEARFWKWRMQGSHVTLAAAAKERLAGRRPDVVLASSMLDLAGFLGAARAAVGDAPAVLYMHENQLTYPPVPGEAVDYTYPMKQWNGMTVADRVVFNSAFHLDAWLAALPGMLKHFPDHGHLSLVDEVAARTAVLPVGVDLTPLAGSPERDGGPPIVLWNHRWEHDKNPGEFFAALDRLAEEGVRFRVAIAGESFRNRPAEFEAGQRRLGHRVVHFGHAPRDDYVRLLRRAGVVVSTAHQEFFGVGVVEAVAAGARPVLPNRLSYPELFPPEYLYDGFERLCSLLREAIAEPDAPPELRDSMRRFDWSAVAPQYDDVLAACRPA